MIWYTRENAAERAGVEPSYLARLMDLGILAPVDPDRFLPGDVRRALMANSLEGAGIPLQGVAAGIGLASAGLPPAHVGLHAGPVLFQEGDYFGQTVNLSARIADYARQGEVLVSQAVADASRETGIMFGDIGPVELKGVSGTVHLLRAHIA